MAAVTSSRTRRVCSALWGVITKIFKCLRDAGTCFIDKIKQDPDPESSWVKAFKKTKLEGLKDIVKPGVHFLEKLFKTLAFILCVTHAVYLISDSAAETAKYPTLISFYHHKISLQKIPFPAVTICPSKIFRKTKLTEAKKLSDFSKQEGYDLDSDNKKWNYLEAQTLVFLMDHICESKSTFSSLLNFSDPESPGLKNLEDLVKDIDVQIWDKPDDDLYKNKIIPFLRQSIVNCSEIVVACAWNGKAYNGKCDALFVPVLTDTGPCCTFNMVPPTVLKKDRSIVHILQQNNQNTMTISEESSWKDWSFEKHFTTEKTENDLPRIQTVMGREFGLTVVLKSNEDEFGCSNSDGKGPMVAIHSPTDDPNMREMGIPLQPNRQVDLKIFADVTIPGDKLRYMKETDRNCYFDNEYKLDYVTKYSESNCFRECLAKKIKEKCQCSQLFMSKAQGGRLCGPLEQSCAKSVESDHFQEGYTQACPECLPSCYEIEYEEKVAYNELEETPFLKDTKKKFGPNSTFTLVHAFYGSKSRTGRQRSRHRDTADAVGTYGGILGLTNGLSIMRMIDVVLGIVMGICAMFHAFLTFLGYLFFGRRPAVSPETNEEAGDGDTETSNIEDAEEEAADEPTEGDTETSNTEDTEEETAGDLPTESNNTQAGDGDTEGSVESGSRDSGHENNVTSSIEFGVRNRRGQRWQRLNGLFHSGLFHKRSQDGNRDQETPYSNDVIMDDFPESHNEILSHDEDEPNSSEEESENEILEIGTSISQEDDDQSEPGVEADHSVIHMPDDSEDEFEENESPTGIPPHKRPGFEMFYGESPLDQKGENVPENGDLKTFSENDVNIFPEAGNSRRNRNQISPEETIAIGRYQPHDGWWWNRKKQNFERDDFYDGVPIDDESIEGEGLFEVIISGPTTPQSDSEF